MARVDDTDRISVGCVMAECVCVLPTPKNGWINGRKLVMLGDGMTMISQANPKPCWMQP